VTPSVTMLQSATQTSGSHTHPSSASSLSSQPQQPQQQHYNDDHAPLPYITRDVVYGTY
jgi:hypothetical protein